MTSPRPAAESARAKFAAARAALTSSLVGRDDEIDLALAALVAREHLLLVGPPGTAKSLLLGSLARWAGGRTFTLLLTKFTSPEEVFGPVSIAGLKEDRYRRVTTNRLPEADLAFLDEVFKASSAVLNTLLKILNERVYENDGVAVRVPLRLCVGASNEWPDPESGGRELHAAFDRFLFRKSVRPLASPSARSRLLWDTHAEPAFAATISPAELDAAHASATALPWSDEAKAALEKALCELAKEGVVPGDRRQLKAVTAARAWAWLAGAAEVQPEHLEPLQHVLWDDPAEQPAKAAAVIARVANPPGMRANRLLLEAEDVISSADARDLAKAAAAAAKLGEIDRQLASLKPDPRVERARAFVKDQSRRIRLASLEAV